MTELFRKIYIPSLDINYNGQTAEDFDQNKEGAIVALSAIRTKVSQAKANNNTTYATNEALVTAESNFLIGMKRKLGWDDAEDSTKAELHNLAVNCGVQLNRNAEAPAKTILDRLNAVELEIGGSENEEEEEEPEAAQLTLRQLLVRQSKATVRQTQLIRHLSHSLHLKAINNVAAYDSSVRMLPTQVGNQRSAVFPRTRSTNHQPALVPQAVTIRSVLEGDFFSPQRLDGLEEFYDEEFPGQSVGERRVAFLRFLGCTVADAPRAPADP